VSETAPDIVPVDDRDAEGRPLRSGEIRDGRFYGQFTAYADGGRPSMRARMHADLLHGEVRHYDGDGALVQVAEFAEGVQQGVTTFYANSRPTCRMTYRAGVLDGPSVFFNDNGTVAATFPYRAGKRDGEAMYYSPQGSLIRRETYVDGQLRGPALAFFDNGAVSERCEFRAGLLEGELCRFFPSGKVMQRGVYQRGVLVEALRTFSEDGKEIAAVQPPKPAGGAARAP